MFETVDITQFKAYLQLAESAGLVAIEQHQDGDGWIALRQQQNTGSNDPSQHAPSQNPPSQKSFSQNSSQNSPSQHARSRFHHLIKILNDLLPEDPEPRFSPVSRRLREIPSVYENAGVKKFTKYIEAAVEAGVITLREANTRDGLITLCPAYHDPPVHPSISASTVSTPPARTDSTTVPFAPLVEFLKSKQLASPQPVSFSSIIAHLVATLGYPDLLSLYASVPGVTTFSQYLDAAVASGVVSLVSGTTASRDALVSLRNTQATRGAGPQPPVPINPATSQRGPFELLISNLTKLWREGKQELTLSEIHSLIMAQDSMTYSRVGTTTIKEYVAKAAAANLVTYDPIVTPGVSFVAPTVRLREPPSHLPDNPPPPIQPNVSATSLPSLPPLQETVVSSPPVNVTLSPFRDLVAVLTELQASTGQSEFRFSSVVPLLLKRRPNVYASVGAVKFTDYITVAMVNGVVKVRGIQQGDGWVSLSDSRPGGLKSPVPLIHQTIGGWDGR